MQTLQSVRGVRIRLASPDQIRSWSFGEVTRAETLNYRTLKPERDGLFCERIFGPVKNFTCACGKYKRTPQYHGQRCDLCGVLIVPARIRRSCMGHIELASPIVHPWFTQGSPSRMGLLLDLTSRDLRDVLYSQRMLVLEVDETARAQELARIHQEIERLQALPPSGSPNVPPVASGDVEMSDAMVMSPMASPASLTHSYEGTVSVEAIVAPTSRVRTVLDEQEIDALLEERDQQDPDEEVTMELLEATSLEQLAHSRAEQIIVGGVMSALEGDPHWRRRRLHDLQRVSQELRTLRQGALLAIERSRFLRREVGHVFQADTGTAALYAVLTQLDLASLARRLRCESAKKEGTARSYVLKRLKLVEALRTSGVKPEWMVMSVIPVLPPELRPVVRTGGGTFVAADLNELYCRVIDRNTRLKHFLAVDAPDIIINREKQSLQIACDALFDNGHSRRPLLNAQKQPLRSLSEILSGKGGRFRHNLLGKRVDYSGRSVISVGLDLHMYQCGLPKKIALELFKPFLIQQLMAGELFETHRQAKRAVERADPAVWDALDEVMKRKVVLLNRAPTLHRLSIQAFEPVLVEGGAIRLHPQVCSAFNADFDGDQMAVHLPLSAEAQAEAREYLLSTHNLLSPASGEPSIAVAQEQVLGCYYLTQERPQKKGAGRLFADESDAIQAYEHGIIDLQAPITVRTTLETIYEQPPPQASTHLPRGSRLRTTVGRILFNQALPKVLRFHNYTMKKDFLRQLVWECIKQCGQERAATMANAIKRLGFHHATMAAISFSMSDVMVPPQKKAILAQADEQAAVLRSEWQEGMMTRQELYQRTIDLWKTATDDIAQHVQSVLDPYGSISTIASSGATKAKLQQIRQLSGMRGLMASPSGAILETPVRGNFLEGLTVAEYFLSSHGARKSMMDRSLNTAQSGYLTIQLVNVAQDVIVTEEDCGTSDTIVIADEESASLGLPDSSSRWFGRVLGEDIPEAGLCKGDELDERAIARLLNAKVTEVAVRSVFTCQARYGVCSACYGWDLSKRALVRKGTAVGIIAAQSIGEPGTQLTMRTFHSGGIAGGQGDITQGIPRVKELFEARVPKDPALVSEIAGVVTVMQDERTRSYHIQVVSDMRALIAKGEGRRTYTVPAGRQVLVQSGQHVRAGDPLTNGARNLQELLHYQGRVALERYLLQEIQLVYRTTGAYIHEKHFEIIIRQMLRYVRVETSGDTTFLPEEIVDRLLYREANARMRAEGKQLATAFPVILGLISATLATESWLAAASFQQTTRVLTDAVLEGRVDHLRGIKENVILGKMIPAGTGLLPRPQQRSPVPRKRGRPRKRARGIVLF